MDLPLEPQLPMEDIQGLIVPGFAKPHETLVGLRLGEGREVTTKFKGLLGELTEDVAPAAAVLKDRREHRTARRHEETRYPTSAPKTLFIAVAFSYAGLRKLTPGADAIPSTAFRQGLAARSTLLGDPASGDGSVKKWEVGGPGNELDVLFIVAGDSRDEVSARARALRAVIENTGAEIAYFEDGNIRADARGHEHFGFDDGISQPGIRGRASDRADDYITDRHIAADRFPEAHLYGYPGQDLVWPGVLLLGQPGTSPDPLIPGPPVPAIPNWTRNGSFLVFRRLVQDVGLFWRTMQTLSRDLAKQPGFEKWTDDKLAARIVGRWQSGAPVNRSPEADDQALGKCVLANNHFRFDSNAAQLPLDPPFDDPFPMSTADPAGTICPWAGHIRKVNTRDSSSDMGGRESTYGRRILRVGIPFGPSLLEKIRYADKDHDEAYLKRGLLFQCVQASIEDQFEFLVTRWMNDPARPKMPGGHDILIGQNSAEGDAHMRRCVIFGDDYRQAQLQTDAQWVIPTGGGYFFVPSISALREVLSSQHC